MPKFAGILVFAYVSACGESSFWGEELYVTKAESLAEAEQEYQRRGEAGSYLNKDDSGQRLDKAFPLFAVTEGGTGPSLLLSRRFSDLELYRRSVTLPLPDA